VCVCDDDDNDDDIKVCADAGWTDAAAAEADCSPVAHVVQVQLQVSCECTQHNERVWLCLYVDLINIAK